MDNYDKIDRLNELFPYVREYQELAKECCNIQDIFQDNGGKLLQVLLVTGLKNLTESREGNDAVDELGAEYELKSVNINLTKSFSTNHHLNQHIIDKYRKVDWVLAVYKDIELVEIYLMTPELLEPFYIRWEKQYKETGKDINNPKIPLSFVRQNGIPIYQNNERNDFFYAPLINKEQK